DVAMRERKSETQANFTDLVNPRPNGELRVLLKLPFDRVFCSSTDYRFLILGVWAERHHLELNQPQPFNGSAPPDAASRPSWRVVDVTEVSRIAEFDFLMDESHGLTKDTEYFVALSGCSSTQCRTAGFAKFNRMATRRKARRISPPSSREAAQPWWRPASLRSASRWGVCDRHTAQLGTVSSASAAAEIPSTEGLGYTTYAEILSDVGRHDNDQSGAGRSVAASSGSEDSCSKNDIEMRDSGASQRSSDLEVISNHEMHTGFGKLDLPAGKF
uniref:Neur_chan_LBD domain-containing protein n=1 Tax=Macrostomum lignano TaxID=282301 RepID=A0A1I8FDF7_9PLAT